MERSYTVGELKALVKEASSRNEFKPKLGDGVEGGNKKNGKAYDDEKEIAKQHYGKELKAPKVAKYEKDGDENCTTLSIEPDSNPSKEWKERTKAQVHGFTSVDEENNDIEKVGETESNKNFYDACKKTDKEMQDKKADKRASGLTASKQPKSNFEHNNGYVNETKKIKTVFFKKTQFLTEGHMISRIPDEFKNEGCTFRMKDKTGNEYLLEWSDNKAVILEHRDDRKFNENLNRMKNLMGYNSSDYFKNTTNAERLNESNDAFTNTLDKARQIIK